MKNIFYFLGTYHQMNVIGSRENIHCLVIHNVFQIPYGRMEVPTAYATVINR